MTSVDMVGCWLQVSSFGKGLASCVSKAVLRALDVLVLHDLSSFPANWLHDYIMLSTAKGSTLLPSFIENTESIETTEFSHQVKALADTESIPRFLPHFKPGQLSDNCTVLERGATHHLFAKPAGM